MVDLSHPFFVNVYQAGKANDMICAKLLSSYTPRDDHDHPSSAQPWDDEGF